MSDSGNENFDEPALKAAACRCWGGECAPAELRAAVQRLMQSIDESREGRSGLFRIPRSTWMLAAAAMVALVAGLSFRYLLPTGHAHSTQLAITLPSTLETDLVVRHDLCCAAGNHQHLPVSKNDDAGIAAVLRATLGRAVLVARPFDPGWTFRGAAICPVGTTPAGHLVFARGSDTFSIFSLPHSVAPALKDGDQFAMTVQSHSIAGFEKDGALFCLVADSPDKTLTSADLLEMRSRMEHDVTVARANLNKEPVVLAELLRPSH
jgi:hypothetical protein